jgi:hypothetical protein
MSEWKEGKIKRPKKRKPMTEEQKVAAAERLTKARAAKGPIQYKNVHPSVVTLPDDHVLSYKKVKEWIKHNRDKATSLRRDVKRNVKGSIAKLASVEGYIRQINHYIQHGDWSNDFYGKDEHMRIKWKTIAPNQQQ